MKQFGTNFKNSREAKAYLEKGNEYSFAPGMHLDMLNSNGDINSTSLGYQYTIQTTTQIRARVIAQKFYTAAPSEFFSVIPGTAAWLEDIKTNRIYTLGGKFESGLQSVSSGPTQKANVDVGVSPFTTAIQTWVGGYTWSTMELSKALQADQWNPQEERMKALKIQYDLGVQGVAFLGLLSDLTGTPGLLTNSEVNIDITTITKNISDMTASEFQDFVGLILSVYYANTNSTQLPNTFVMPMDDFLGLGVATASDFPIGTKIDYLENMFKRMTGNPGFKIKPLVYSQMANNAGFVSQNGKDRYVLYNDNPDTLLMDMPLPFNLLAPGTSNNFDWEGVAYGQFTGVSIFRPAEVMYFDHT